MTSLSQQKNAVESLQDNVTSYFYVVFSVCNYSYIDDVTCWDLVLILGEWCRRSFLIMCVMFLFGHEDTSEPWRLHCPLQTTWSVFTLYRIVFSRARESYRMGYQFTNKNGDFGAISVQRREAVPRRTLKWKVTYRIDVHTIPDGFSCRHQSLSGIVWS